MTLESIKGLQVLIMAFISYNITITCAGWFEAFIAKKVGDDAPEQMGFLTLNPLEHFNVFGFAALLWGEFYAHVLPIQLIPGWGRFIPLVPDNIHGRYYRLRVFTEYISRSIAHFIILLMAATCVLLLTETSHVQNMSLMVAGDFSSFTNVIIALSSFIIKQNMILFIIHFVIGIFKYLIYFHMPKIQDLSFATILFSFIALVIGLTLFEPILKIIIFKSIAAIRAFLLMF